MQDEEGDTISEREGPAHPAGSAVEVGWVAESYGGTGMDRDITGPITGSGPEGKATDPGSAFRSSPTIVPRLLYCRHRIR